jgi:ankyrin repeat protein
MDTTNTTDATKAIDLEITNKQRNIDLLTMYNAPTKLHILLPENIGSNIETLNFLEACIASISDSLVMLDYLDNFLQNNYIDLDYHTAQFNNDRPILFSAVKKDMLLNESDTISVIKCLIKHGIDLENTFTSDQINYFFCCLMFIDVCHRFQVLKLLLELGANINEHNKYSPFIFLCFRTQILNELTDEDRECDIFIETHLRKYVDLFLQYGANLNFKSIHEDGTALEYILIMKDKISYIVAKILIDKGINCNNISRNGVSTLCLICLRPDITEDKIELLLKSGADPNLKNKTGDTVLHVMARKNRLEEINFKAIEMLIKHGADINVKNNSGNTALNVLMFKGWNDENPEEIETNKRIGKIFAEAGANYSVCDTKKQNYLHHVCSSKISKAQIEFLLEKGVDPNVQNINGDTPLHFIATKANNEKNLEIINILIAAGGRLLIPNKKNITPFCSIKLYKLRPVIEAEINKCGIDTVCDFCSDKKQSRCLVVSNKNEIKLYCADCFLKKDGYIYESITTKTDGTKISYLVENIKLI